MSWSTSLSAKALDTPEERLVEARQLLRRKLGKWQLERVLGVGATSSVFEGVHNNGHRVAIKVLHSELAFNLRVRQRFLREGYLANRVGHPGVVSVIDDGTAKDGTVFLVLELLSGQSLSSRVARAGGRLDTHEVLRLALDVLDVLVAAHAKGIIHRDIKPANVFATDAGTTKVLDFGLARLCDVPADVFQSGSGALLGTPAYMAPEQARGAPGAANAQTDLWCLGATMFRLLSGRTVHSAATVNQLIIATATEAAAPLAAVAPWVEEDICRVIDRALKLDPRDRWGSAAEMRAAVAAALPGCASESGESTQHSGPRVRAPLAHEIATLPEQTPSTVPSLLPVKAPRKNRGWFVAGALTVALVSLPVALARYAAWLQLERRARLEHLPAPQLSRALASPALHAALAATREAQPEPSEPAFVEPAPVRSIANAPARPPRSLPPPRRSRSTPARAASAPAQAATPNELPDTLLDHRE